MEVPETLPACREGKAAFDRFDRALGAVLSVSRAEYERREAEYQKQQATKPKRGPKPKLKTSSSGRASRRTAAS